jgi:hypothetical protein
MTQTTLYQLRTTAGSAMCDTAYSNTVTVTVIPTATASDITINNDTICYNLNTTLTATASGITSPVFKWYSSQTENTPFHTGASYTTSALTTDTTFYISVSDTGLCENAQGDRQAVTVTLTSLPPESVFVDDIWYFGENTAGSAAGSPGIRFVKDSMGNYTAQDASGVSKVYSQENSLVVSSPYCDGQNIFYSSHNQLYNSLHQPMQNGTFAGHYSVADGLATCYMGDNKYLFFTVDNAAEIAPRALKAYVVDMNADNGKGARTGSEIIVEPTHANMSETIELLARAGTTNQYWLIYAHCNGSCASNYSNELRVRLVDVSNPNNPQIGPIYSRIPKRSGIFAYTLKASSQYNRLAIACQMNGIDIFDFDNSTGILSNLRSITGTSYNYGIEFSPDGNQLYATQYNAPGNLYQYDISGTLPVQVANSPIQYWTQTGSNYKGGGMKLGPDGKIYVSLWNSNKVGTISNPNATTTLSSRYNASAMTLSVTYNALPFSTGLTKPAIMGCNVNNIPVALSDSAAVCGVSATNKTITVNVISNDTDMDGDAIYLTEAEFANAADTALGSLTINADLGTVTLTLKSPQSLTATHVFYIIYSIKDNGLPASQCARGNLTIAVTPVAVLTSDTLLSICSGTTFSYTAQTGISGTTFSWTREAVNGISQSGSTGSGSSLTEILTNTTSSPVTVTYLFTMTTDSCTHTQSVRVMVLPLPEFTSVSDTTVCTAVTLSDLVSNIPLGSVIRFYRDVDGNTLLPSPRVDILSDTLYYVRVIDTATGCLSVMHTINIHQGSYPIDSPTTGPNSVCIGDTITLSNAAPEGGVWSISYPSTVAEIVSQGSDSVRIKGLTEGRAFVSYTIGTGYCQTTMTSKVKVISPAPPKIIIGLERP